MITSIHALIYSDNPEATRAFLRDVLQWPSVRDPRDSSPELGWLIFRSGPSEVGVHPTSGTYEGESYSHPRHHLVAVMCDDVEATVSELSGRGGEFTGEVSDYGYGLAIMMQVPGADDIQLYQPTHPVAYDL